MPNPRPRTYTEHVPVALTVALRELLRRHAAANDTGISTLMREAALKAIGRPDLSLAKDLDHRPPGKLLERRRSRASGGKRFSTSAVVSLTRQQKKALERAALSRGIRISHLLRTAALEEASIAQPKPRDFGRPLGH